MPAIVALCAFSALAASLVCCLRRRTSRSAFVLAAFSGFWLVANNNVIEGPILFSLNDQHGLTLMDLFSYLGAVVAIMAQLTAPPPRQEAAHPGTRVWPARLTRAAVAGALVAAGLAVSYFYQPGG